MKKGIVLFVVFAITFLIGMTIGKRQGIASTRLMFFSHENIESQFGIDVLDDVFIEVMCRDKNLDPQGDWTLLCKECMTIHVSHNSSGGIWSKFEFNEKGIFCIPCGYQVGVDWVIF